MKRLHTLFFTISLAILASQNVANADTTEGHSLRIPFILADAKHSVLLDGVLDEQVWKDAAQLELPFVTSPFDNTAAPVKTQAFYYEDGEHFYFAFHAFDPDPKSIRAFLRDRDSSWGEDLVGIKLDTYGDGRLAYQFFLNPYGIQTDAIENEMTGSESSSWNAIWESSGRIVDDGYIVEAKIPLGLMNFAKSEGPKKWGIEFVRFYPRNNEYRISHLPYDRANACTLCQMGPISGFEQAKQGQNLALVPTVVLATGRQRDPEQTNDWQYSQNQELGADLRWAVSPEITISATLNPDFSQVESDSAELSINNTFALYFDEKRPFFVENEDYFSSNLNLVYTRNINAPDYGVKVTGRKESHSLGVFFANDANTTFVVPGNLGSRVAIVEEESLNFAARYRYDISPQLAAGLVTTLRSADSYHNYVTAGDIKYRMSDQDTLSAQVVRSDTLYPEGLSDKFCPDLCDPDTDLNESALRTRSDSAFSGLAYTLEYQHEDRDYAFSATHIHNDEGFRADLGSESRVDRKKTVVGGEYRWWNENDWWNRIRLRGDWDITHNMQNELLERELEGDISILGAYQSYAQLGWRTRTRVGLRQDSSNLRVDNNADKFNEDSMTLYLETRPLPNMMLEAFVRKGDSIDFSNNRLAEQVVFEPALEIDIGKHIKLSLEHTFSKLDAAQKPLFSAHLSDFRVSYQFDQRQFLRLTLAYADIKRNAENYLFTVDEKSRDLGFQLLYSYKLNPLTKFFVGFSQSAYDNDRLSNLETNAQSVFMKFSYAWTR